MPEAMRSWGRVRATHQNSVVSYLRCTPGKLSHSGECGLYEILAALAARNSSVIRSSRAPDDGAPSNRRSRPRLVTFHQLIIACGQQLSAESGGLRAR
jgi:hypothetical protein